MLLDPSHCNAKHSIPVRTSSVALPFAWKYQWFKWSRRPGRPGFQIPEEVIRGLHDIHGVWKEVAKEAGVSYKTVLIRRHQYSLVVNETTGSRITYSDIPNCQLCQVVNELLQIMPNTGETYITAVVFIALQCEGRINIRVII